MANSVAPDSWEQQADSADTTADSKFLEGKFSTLNVNAAEFVPSFCINSMPQSNTTSEETNDDDDVPPPTAGENDTSDLVQTKITDFTTTSVPPETHHG